MLFATVKPGGEVTLPDEVLERWNLGPGDRLIFEQMEGHTVIRKDLGLNGLAGCLAHLVKFRYPPERTGEEIIRIEKEVAAAAWVESGLAGEYADNDPADARRSA